MENLEKELKTAIDNHKTEDILRLRADIIQKSGFGNWISLYSKLDKYGARRTKASLRKEQNG